ncbi:MAG: NAD-dependent protein deacylase [Acutalibacter sp.]
MTGVETLRQWIQESKQAVFLGGAGVSTASGIPDFRSAHGIYQQKKAGLSYEEMLSHGYFVRHTEEFYRFYRDVMLYPGARPNGAHYALAKLEQEGKLRAVVTQNIDGLHQLAGSQNVLELHGSELRNTCLSCGKKYGMEKILQSEGVPTCTCGGVIKPDVVLYGEQLNEGDLRKAIRYAAEADLMIVAGTSLVVYPVAGLVEYLRAGAKLAIVNRDPTPYDGKADLVIREDLVAVLEGCAGIAQG